MKNQPFYRRVGLALRGIRVAFRSEASFRTQCFGAGFAAILLAVTRPGPLWTAVVIITVAAVLASELMNTALEFILDLLHPEQHPAIAKAKDCAAGGVLVLSLASIAVAIALVWHCLSI